MNIIQNLKKSVLLAGCISLSTIGFSQHFIREGIWRGSFQFPSNKEAPFDFEVFGTSVATAKVYLINAQERVAINHFKKTSDSLYIYLDQYDNEIAFRIVEGDSLHGVLRKQDGTGIPTTLTATQEDNFRFPLDGPKAHAHIDGKWALTFNEGVDKGNVGIGVFTQKSGIIHGTVMTSSGDYRFLDGVVKGDNFYISTFNGAAPLLFEGKIDNAKTLSGTFYTPTESIPFNGIKDENATLPDPFKLTSLKSGHAKLNFLLPDLEGKQISLNDEKYKNKVVIVSITNSENSNCVDETAFLSQWFRHHKHRGMELVTISYERNTDPAHVQKVLNRLKKKYSIQHEQLFGGKSAKEDVMSTLPSLENFVAFPTLFFIDKHGNVHKTHTGFYGPATGKFHDTFVKEFNAEIDLLMKEGTNATVIK